METPSAGRWAFSRVFRPLLIAMIGVPLGLPHPALALRTEQLEALDRRVGLEEALRPDDPHAVVRAAAVGAAGLEEAGRTTTWTMLPERHGALEVLAIQPSGTRELVTTVLGQLNGYPGDPHLVSVPIRLLPESLQQYLRRIAVRTVSGDTINLFEYVTRELDEVIFAPYIIVTAPNGRIAQWGGLFIHDDMHKPISELSLTANADRPGWRVIYIALMHFDPPDPGSTQLLSHMRQIPTARRSERGDVDIVPFVVEETAHMETTRLVIEGRLSPEHYDRPDFHQFGKLAKLLRLQALGELRRLLQADRPDLADRADDFVRTHEQNVLEDLARHNRAVGLPPEDRRYPSVRRASGLEEPMVPRPVAPEVPAVRGGAPDTGRMRLVPVAVLPEVVDRYPGRDGQHFGVESFQGLVAPITVAALPDGSVVIGDKTGITYRGAIHRPDGTVIPLVNKEGRSLADEQTTVSAVTVDEHGALYVATTSSVRLGLYQFAGRISKYDSSGTLLASYDLSYGEHTPGSGMNVQGLVVFENVLYYTIADFGELRVLDLASVVERTFPVRDPVHPDWYGAMNLALDRQRRVLWIINPGSRAFQSGPFSIPDFSLTMWGFDIDRQQLGEPRIVRSVVDGKVAFDPNGQTMYVADRDRLVIHALHDQRGYLGSFPAPGGLPPTALNVSEGALLIAHRGGVHVIPKTVIPELLVDPVQVRPPLELAAHTTPALAGALLQRQQETGVQAAVLVDVDAASALPDPAPVTVYADPSVAGWVRGLIPGAQIVELPAVEPGEADARLQEAISQPLRPGQIRVLALDASISRAPLPDQHPPALLLNPATLDQANRAHVRVMLAQIAILQNLTVDLTRGPIGEVTIEGRRYAIYA